MNILRPYQKAMIAAVDEAIVDGYRRIILTSPTGSGKTVTAGAMIHSRALTGRKSLFIVDKLTLVDQAIAHLEAIGLRVGRLQGGKTNILPTDEVIVCTVQTIGRRGVPDADFILIDEVNNLHKTAVKLMERWNNLPFIGLTATPMRQDLGKHFEIMVRGPSVRALTDQGYLVPARAFCPSAAAMQEVLNHVKTVAGDYLERDLATAVNVKELIGDITRTWMEKSEGKKTLVFAVNCAHSRAITESFVAEGVHAVHMDYRTPTEEREVIIKSFKEGNIQVLCSVVLLAIGFDVPDAACAILARPTLSEALHMQQLGRVLRPAEGKTEALILDHSGNTLKFGLPVDFIPPDLNSEDRPDTKARRKQVKMLACTDCGFAMEPGQQTCPNCGVDRPEKKSNVTNIEGELIEYGSNDSGEVKYTQDDLIEIYRGFLWYAERSRTGKLGAAYYSTLEMTGFKAPKEWQRMGSIPPRGDVQNYRKYKFIKWRKQQEKLSRPVKKSGKLCKSCNGDLQIEKSDTIHHYGYRCKACGQHNGWVPKATQISMGLIEESKRDF